MHAFIISASPASTIIVMVSACACPPLPTASCRMLLRPRLAVRPRGHAAGLLVAARIPPGRGVRGAGGLRGHLAHAGARHEEVLRLLGQVQAPTAQAHAAPCRRRGRLGLACWPQPRPQQAVRAVLRRGKEGSGLCPCSCSRLNGVPGWPHWTAQHNLRTGLNFRVAQNSNSLAVCSKKRPLFPGLGQTVARQRHGARPRPRQTLTAPTLTTSPHSNPNWHTRCPFVQ